MKINLLVVLLFCSFLGISQTKNFVINWEEASTISTNNTTIEVPAFSIEHFNYSSTNGITYANQWESKGTVDEKSVVIKSMQTEQLSVADLKTLSQKLIPTNPQLKVTNTTARNSSKTYLEISPIFNENGILKKVLSFTISYQLKPQAKAFKKTSSLTSSVLKSGEWYRFAVDTTGVHKLSKSFLSDLGINVNNVNPQNIKVYGHGGASLPLLNSETVSNDLIENSIQFIGESDGIINDEDHILMYAIGPKNFNPDNNSHINPYSDVAYYYINVGTTKGLRMRPAAEPTAAPVTTITTFHDYKFVESDDYNLSKMGRRWFGHRFYVENVRKFDFEFPNLIPSIPIRLKIYTAAVSESTSSMQVKLNGADVGTLTFSAIDKQNLASERFYNNLTTSNSNSISVELSYNNNGNPSASGYLDYISIEAECTLESPGTQFQFKNNATATQSGVGAFEISKAATISEVWDITNPYQISYYTNPEAAAQFSFKTNLGTLKNYQAVSASDYYAPKRVRNSTVSNQDIKGTVFLDNQGGFKDVDYLIITPDYLYTQAERLAQLNRTNNNLNVKVYNLKSIYQEFSSGMQDIAAIRNFVKYVYDNASSSDNKLKYVCLFGDASFDYKDRVSNNTNIVPSWYSLNSFSLTNSFISDDFYGMMDANEGTMANSDKLDIAVGRILAENTQRAKDMVDKVASYYQPEAFGSWRNNFLLISDDVDKTSDALIQQTTDAIAESVKAQKPYLNVSKIHADSYVQETSAGGPRYSLVNKAIFDALEVGAVVVNYFGHGGEDGLAGERIFDKINAQEVNNPTKLNCFVTVTCEYTKFDNPFRETAGEYLFWNKTGGAIGLITTTRQIYVNVGISFNETLGQYLFAFGANQKTSIAEALRQTKNDPMLTNSSQRRLVFFIGDPALKLPIADPDIQVTKINNEPINSTTQVLKGLSKAKIEGQVTDSQGGVLTSYNGILTATIYDKDIQRSTLGNDGTKNIDNSLIIIDFDALGEVIFRGQASVINGQFEIEFVVPKDISLQEGTGKISLYSKTEALLQNRGYNLDVVIGGLNADAPEDNLGPTIALFMNDENFISGGITNENPTLLANLFDENGINTASGIGHDLVATLDGDETNVYKLNDYYTAAVDDYKRGTLSYPFRDLAPGLHTLSVKAWDVYNNSSIQDIQFMVFDKDESLELRNVLNFPNPFVNYTEFWFSHNSSEVLDVSIQIFTISGKLIKTINRQTSGLQSSVTRNITWDGTDDFGSKIGKGVYVYKLSVRSSNSGMTAEKIEKLVIL